jgi:diketogulonate reductase-like aldo/keto reductase
MQLLSASIPRSGQVLPRLGLGTYRSFDQDPSRLAQTELPQVLQAFYDAGGRLLDSSPMYGQAEAVSGRLSQELGLNEGLFMATKVWTQGAAQGREQMEESLQKLGRSKLELMQVHNLTDWEAHWPLLEDWKEAGRFRYIGITHYSTQAFERLAQVIRSRTVDFLQIPYSMAETAAEQSLLPLAADKGVAVIANEPFDQGGLFAAAQGRPVPAWVAELGIYTWAQYFLKFILADPRVQFVIPATSKLAHLEDLLPGGAGPLPNAEQRQRMRAEFQGGLRRQAHS